MYCFLLNSIIKSLAIENKPRTAKFLSPFIRFLDTRKYDRGKHNTIAATLLIKA